MMFFFYMLCKACFMVARTKQFVADCLQKKQKMVVLPTICKESEKNTSGLLRCTQYLRTSCCLKSWETVS